MTTPPGDGVTLEQIATQTIESPFYCATNQAVLARELLAHDDRLNGAGALIDALTRRLDALESASARPTTCTCGIRTDAPAGPNHGPGCPMEVTAESLAILRDLLARCEGERDEFKRERDDYAHTAVQYLTRARGAEQQLDAARGALAKYGRHHGGCASLRADPSDPFFIPCTCGLADALASTEGTTP